MKFGTFAFSGMLALACFGTTLADFAEDTCSEPQWVPQDNTKSPTKKVRCCAGNYGKKKDSYASCDTSSCPNNFNHSKNRNCFNYGAPQNGKNANPNAGSEKCPYADSDHAICDTSYYDKLNNVSCRENPAGKNYQVHCLGKVKCNTVGVKVPQKGHSDGTADYDSSGNKECSGATGGFKAGDDCFYDGSSENWKVCEPDDTSTPEPTKPPKPSSGGDPHFTTWGGEKYDFHGECDLVLVDNPDFNNGLGLHIHIRTKIHAWWSSIASAAVRVGENTLEIGGDEGNHKIPYWLNGVEVSDMQTGDASFGDYALRFRRINDHQSQARLDLGHTNAVSIETFKHFVRVNLKAGETQYFEGSLGMLGSYPGGLKVGRDKQTRFEDAIAFGQEWQVTPADHKLFHSDGVVQHPQKCVMPDATIKKNSRRLLGESALSEEAAALACARVPEEDYDACVFDVLATNDTDMAGSY